MSTDLKNSIEEHKRIKAELKATRKDLASIQTNEASLIAKQKEVEEQLAEAKKPKTRSGDVVISPGGNKGVVVLDKGCLFVYWEDGVKTKANLPHRHKGNPQYNIFDDLADMSENVTEFEMTDGDAIATRNINARIQMSGSAWVQFRDDKGQAKACLFNGGALSEFILKLRQMEATIKRQAAK